MSQQYLFKCECGFEHKIGTEQAGEPLGCDCGRQLEVPSLREIRKLRQVAVEAKNKKRTWHPAQGVLFFVGALLFLGPFTWSGLIQMERNKLNLKEDPRVHQVLEQHLENIESLAIHQTYTNWKMIKSMGLGRREAPAYVINRERHSYWGRIQQIMLITAAAGAILIVTSLTIRPGKKKAAAP